MLSMSSRAFAVIWKYGINRSFLTEALGTFLANWTYIFYVRHRTIDILHIYYSVLVIYEAIGEYPLFNRF